VLVLLAIYATVAALVASIVVSSVRFARLIPSYDGEWHALVRTISSALSNAGIDASQVQQAGSTDLSQLVGRVADVLGGAWFPDRLRRLPLRRRRFG